jgi:RND superfamily putative drug exporter
VRYELEVGAGPDAGRRIPLDRELLLGNAVEGEGRLHEDCGMSERHARLVQGVHGELVLEDLDSVNGTWVNGKRVDGRQALASGDTLELGQTTFRVADAVGGRAEQATPARSPGPTVAGTGLSRRPVLSNLADRLHARRWLILVAVGFFAVAAGALGGNVVKELSAGDDFSDPSSSSVVAQDRLARAAGAEPVAGVLLLVSAKAPIVDPTRDARVRPKGSGRQPRSTAAGDTVREAERRLEHDPAIAHAISYYDTGSPAFISDDRRKTYVAAFLKPGADKQAMADRLDASVGGLPNVQLGGSALAGPALGAQAEKDLRAAESIALPLLFLVSLFVFRGVVAALLPVFVGVVTVLGTFLGLKLINGVQLQSVFALNMVVGLGLGLAIDYSLFILSRYREELARVGPGLQALRQTISTAGRTVLFSACTVCAALLSLMVFPQRFLSSMGTGGALCTVVAASTALIALPALLAVLGPRVNALAPRAWQRASDRAAHGEERGFWYRLSHGVMRHPLPIALACSAALIAAGLPFLHVKFTGVDATVLPTSSPVRQVSDTLGRDFSRDPEAPISLAVDAPPTARRKLDGYVGGLRKLPGVVAVAPPARVGAALWQVDVTPARGPFDDGTQDLVRRIRSGRAPFAVAASGEAAAFVDQQASLGARLPVALALLVTATVVVLFVLTGSVVLPLKSVLMNFLGLSATFGLLVLIFQEGHLEGLLGFHSQGALNATQPILLFIVAFGLSTDYGVFLLTRIKEQHDAGVANREAVATGLQRTGRIVTAAALLFSVALGAFATSQIVFIKLIGVGAVLAVLIDSSIIRALLVPALMAMLGTRNWWAPRPLRRLYERIGLSEG